MTEDKKLEVRQFNENFVKLYFDTKNIQLRHEIIEGISNISTEFSVPILEEILNKGEENNRILNKIISSYIEQLKSIK